MVAAASGAPLSRPWCANPRALGGARVAEKFPRWSSVPISAILPEGRAGAGTFRAALPAPDQASTQPSPVALSFVSTAQHLAQPSPGGVTALGDSGAWAQECPAWELHWALLAAARLRSGRRGRKPPLQSRGKARSRGSTALPWQPLSPQPGRDTPACGLIPGLPPVSGTRKPTTLQIGCT